MSTKPLIREENLEYISRVIGDCYSGFPLSEKLKKIGVPADVIVYPNTKWRMVFDVMSYCSLLEDENKALKLLGKIIELAVHPLNFGTTDSIGKSEKMVVDFNKRLAFDKVAIKELDGEYRLLKLSSRPETKTSTDYVMNAITFFKDEYNKVRIAGLKYEYEIGDSVDTLTNMYDLENVHVQEAIDENRAKRNAIEQLHKVGFIKEYVIEERTKDVYHGCDYAICFIDESKLTRREEPLGTDYGAETIAQTVVKHEHTHRFENNIQEKDIVLNHKYEKDKPNSFYITKKDDDFYYKGQFINISKTSEYYKVFCALYAKLPEGGEISYKNLIAEIKSRMPKHHSDTNDVMQKFIQRNLTDRSNGFVRYAGIPDTEDNGKPLISVSRGKGIIFNNKTG